MRTLTWDQVRGRRLARSCLLEPELPDRLTRLVGNVCCVQAQVLSAAELAIGARVTGATQEFVHNALWRERLLVKTYGPRGTLHLVPADELALWMAAMRAVSTGARDDGLSDAIGEALDGRTLTRKELAEEVGRRLGVEARERLSSTWGSALPPAAFAGRLCFAPGRGARVAFVRADQWIPGWSELDEEEALAEVFLRYVGAYAPVTARGFARWLLVGVDRARDLVDSCRDQLEEVEVEGDRAWVRAGDADVEWEAAQDSVVLVPQYDCYILNGNPRERVLPASARARVFAYGRGRYEGAAGLNVLLVGGQVSGIWRRKRRATHIEVHVEPFGPLPRSHHARLESEVRRIGRFHGCESLLVLGPLGA